MSVCLVRLIVANDIPAASAASLISLCHTGPLAHRISDKAEAAYRRGDQFEKRRKLMEAWAAFCEPRTSAKIVPIAQGVKR